MNTIVGDVLGNLSGIGHCVYNELINDFLLHHPPPSPEQGCSLVRADKALIRSQQNDLIYQAGEIKEQNRTIRELEDLLTQKDKEIRYLTDTIRSLEFQLQEANHR
ncbi:MAG TPA: hypothetical protein VIO61_16165 [Anaerolineaceae bacterium]